MVHAARKQAVRLYRLKLPSGRESKARRVRMQKGGRLRVREISLRLAGQALHGRAASGPHGFKPKNPGNPGANSPALPCRTVPTIRARLRPVPDGVAPAGDSRTIARCLDRTSPRAGRHRSASPDSFWRFRLFLLSSPVWPCCTGKFPIEAKRLQNRSWSPCTEIKIFIAVQHRLRIHFGTKVFVLSFRDRIILIAGKG